MNRLDEVVLRQKANAAHEEALEEDRMRQVENEARRSLVQAKCHALNALHDKEGHGAIAVVLVEEVPPWLGIFPLRPRRSVMAAWELCGALNRSRKHLEAAYMRLVFLSDGRIGKVTQNVPMLGSPLSQDGEPYVCHLAEEGDYTPSLMLNILQNDARFRP